MPDTKKESLYSVTALVLMIISIVVGGVFYMTQKDRMVAEVPTAMPTPTLTEQTQDTSPLPTIPGEPAALKIAVPNEAIGLLVDQEGRQTGAEGDVVLNDIPQSDYAPDEVAGTVTWILVDNPQRAKYTLRIDGSSDKAIAVYLKGQTGNETLELIDISSLETLKTYSITIDPTSPAQPIVVNKL